MNPRLFRLLENCLRIDRALHAEQRRGRPDPVPLIRLQVLQLRARLLTRRLASRLAAA